MTLILTMLRCPDAVAPETREVAGGEYSVGRGAENDWVLADPERHLSKRHCVLAFRSGGWQLADTSTNGTFLNRETEPVGAGRPRPLKNGDRVHLGPYEIEVRLVEAESLFTPRRAAPAPAQHDDPFGDDPFAPPRPAFDPSPVDHGLRPEPMQLPPDFDPLAAEAADDGLGFPTQPDHNSGLEDAFRPPSPPAGQIPDDWDLDLSAARPTPPPPARQPPPRQAAPPPPPVAEPAAPPRRAAIPELPDELPSIAMPPPRPVPARQPPVAPPRDELESVSIPPPARPAPSPPPAAPVAPAADAGLQERFFRGAGMSGAKLADPAATFEELGRAFRVVVAGLREALIARAAIKGEFRIEQTMIRSSGNNPLKFSVDADDALTALFGIGRRVAMQPSAAVSDAMRDMRLHELATMSAVQSAVRALIAQFDPQKLREGSEQGGLALVPAQKKARAWDAFEKLHGRIGKALSDDFDSVFGKAFARAYEQALDEMKDRESSRP